MKHHPYSEIWPLMEGEDFKELTADIKANGQRLSITTYKGMILDGRNRERACKAAGIEPWYIDAGEISDKQALKLVVSLNDHRRHMSMEESAFAAEKLANIINGHNQKFTRIEGGSTEAPSISSALSRQQAAKMMNVSLTAVQRARVIRTYGTEDDVAQVKNRKVSLSKKAEDLLKKNPRTKKVAVVPGPRYASVLRFHKAPPLKPLTRHDVDPEFTGTPIEFTDKYGHVQIQSAQEYATMRFSDLTSEARVQVQCKKGQPERKSIDLNWLRAPKPYDVAKLEDAMNILRPLFAEYEAALATAKAALVAADARKVGEK